MKNLSLLFAGPLLALGLCGTAHADERPEHFEGEASATLDQALANFANYNAQLAAVLAEDDMRPEHTAKIHELTYTLENALEKIASELDDLAETLESVHVASERYEVDTVRAQGRKYLDTAAKIAR
ncbi:DUF6746 family protein [Luteimonas sp. A537]